MTEDVVRGWMQSMLPRFVAFLGPLVLAVVTAGLVWFQNAIGIDLQNYRLGIAAFVTATIGGGLLLLATWVLNAGRGQIALAVATVNKMHADGARLLAVPVPDTDIENEEQDAPEFTDATTAPTQPPGLSPEAPQ